LLTLGATKLLSDSIFLQLHQCSSVLHGKNDFTERSKFLLDIENNFVGILKINNTAETVNILGTNLSVLYNYFNSSTKLLF